MNADRYLAIVSCARKRYARGGLLIVSVGGVPSAYSWIENAAWSRYMGAS
jgi:hypothetical protein